MKGLILILSIFALVSCNNLQQERTIDKKQKTDILQENPTQGILIKYDSVSVIKKLKIIDRNGADIFQRPDYNSSKLLHFEYGKEIEIISEEDDFYGIRERVSRELISNGNKIERQAWEKVYIAKSMVGGFNEIHLQNADLNILSYKKIGAEYEYYSDTVRLSELIQIELVNKQMYISQKEKSYNFISKDSSNVRKEKGEIELICLDTVVKFIDKPNMETEESYFSYIGYIDTLDMFLIAGSYWEYSDFKMVNKVNGKISTFRGYPNLSIDLKYVISIAVDPYDQSTDFELFEINANPIKKSFELILKVGFANWMPTYDNGNIFFGQDNCLYVPVNHSESYWDKNGNINENYEYIKIKIL